MASNTKNSPPGPFQPYVNSINENDPIMKRVPFNRMDIGANGASMQGIPGNGVPSIEHVGKMPTKA